MPLLLLGLAPILMLIEKKAKKNSTIFKYEFIISFLLYTICTFLIMKLTGVLDSGYHLMDDHETYSIGRDLSQYGLAHTLILWLQKDLNIRFRFTYFVFRILECFFFGDNFYLWHVFHTFLASCGLFFAYVFARKMKCPFWLSYVFSILIYAGGQIAVFWRLGPQENWGIILLMLTFLAITRYIHNKTAINLSIIVILTILLGGIKESFLLLVPLLPILLIFWELRAENHAINIKNIFYKLKENIVYICLAMTVFIIDMLIIIFLVGTNKIGYAGIDSSMNIKDYIVRILDTCTDDLKTHFFALLISFFIILLPYIYSIFKEKNNSYNMYILVSTLIFCYIWGTQLILHAKSGMPERYALPTSIALGLFWIIDLYHIIKKHTGIHLLFCTFILATMTIGIVDSNIWKSSIDYAMEGKATTSLLSDVAKYKQANPLVVVATEYEYDYSISIYLEEKYGLNTVYNVFYSPSSTGMVTDGYIHIPNNESTIHFSDAEIYVGYSRELERLFEKNNINLNTYNCYDHYNYKDYSMYVLKSLDS